MLCHLTILNRFESLTLIAVRFLSCYKASQRKVSKTFTDPLGLGIPVSKCHSEGLSSSPSLLLLPLPWPWSSWCYRFVGVTCWFWTLLVTRASFFFFTIFVLMLPCYDLWSLGILLPSLMFMVLLDGRKLFEVVQVLLQHHIWFPS